MTSAQRAAEKVIQGKEISTNRKRVCDFLFFYYICAYGLAAGHSKEAASRADLVPSPTRTAVWTIPFMCEHGKIE